MADSINGDAPHHPDDIEQDRITHTMTEPIMLPFTPPAIKECADKMFEDFKARAGNHYKQDVLNAAQRLMFYADQNLDRRPVGEKPFTRCNGCDGHECIDRCAYPGVGGDGERTKSDG